MAGQTPGSADAGIKKVFATALTETKSYDAEGIGTIRFEGNNVYKWVKYNEGSGTVAAVAGNVAYYLTGSPPTGYEDDEVTSDLSDSDNVGAGVLQSAIAHGEFGWVKIRGPATLNTALAAGADGNALTAVGATDGTLDASAAATDAIVGYVYDATQDKIICDFPF